MKKNIICSLVFILTFLFVAPSIVHGADEKEVIRELNGAKIVWYYNDFFYEKGDVFKGITERGLDERMKYDAVLFSDGNKVIYTEGDGYQALKVYDAKRGAYFDVRPYQIEITLDNRGYEDAWYYGFQLSPDGKFVQINYLLGLKPILNLFIYDLKKLSDLIDKIPAKADDGVIINAKDYVSLKDALIEPVSDKEAYNFKWNPDGSFTFRSSDRINANQFDTDQKELAFENIFKGDPDSGKATKIGTYPPPPFKDLSETDPDYEAVLKAKEDGWLKGYPDGTVRLDKPINRAEFIKIAAEAFDSGNFSQEYASVGVTSVPVPPEVKFICPDTPADQWYSVAMYSAKEAGIIKGYPVQGTPKETWKCKPEQNINKVEALKIVLNLSSLNTDEIDFKYYNQYADTSYKEWYSPYTAYSRLTKLLKYDAKYRLHPADPLTRREMITMTVEMKDRVERAKTQNIPPSFDPDESVYELKDSYSYAEPADVKAAAPDTPITTAVASSSPAIIPTAHASYTAPSAPAEPEAALPEPEFPPIPSYLTPGKTVRVCTETQPYKCEVIKLPRYGVTVNEEPVYVQYADPWLWYILTISGKDWYTPWDDLREGYEEK